MKHKKLLIGMIALTLLAGCAPAAETTAPENTSTPVVTDQATATEDATGKNEETPRETDSEENSSEGNGRFPEGIVEKISIKEKYPALEQLIIDTYEIPEDYFATTRYYYEEIDLNTDGAKELFVVIMGPYTSGSGGSSGMIVYPVGEELHVNQTFTLVQTPIIISDTITNGAKEIIAYRSGGGGDASYVRLTCSDGYYTSISDGESIDSLEGITGRAIIADDILGDMENETFLTLDDTQGE